MPSLVSSDMPEHIQLHIMDSLIGATFILHSGGKAVLEFSNTLFGKAKVAQSIEYRRQDEKMVGTNGGFGEGGACTSLARAYHLLVEQGEQANADELNSIAMTRFLKADFEHAVNSIKAGWLRVESTEDV